MKTQHLTFIHEYIRTGNRILAYQSAYPGTQGESLRAAAARLYNKPHIRERINAIMQPIREKAIAELQTEATERVKEEICTLQQRREVLAKIILGKWQVKKHLRLKDNIVEVFDSPSANAVIRAIDMDSKLAANKYKEKLPEEKKEPAYNPYIDPDFVPQPAKTDLPFTPNPHGSIPGEPEYEYWFQKDVEDFKRNFPHLPHDYLTNPKYMPWKDRNEDEETVTENENSVTICNHISDSDTNNTVHANIRANKMPHKDTLDLWQQYVKLEPQLRHLTPEQLKHRESNFRKLRATAQYSLLRPLLQTIDDKKAYVNRFRQAS